MPAAFEQERVVGRRQVQSTWMNGLDSNASDLHVTIDRGVATLWLNRPAKRNAVTYDMWVGIAERCRQLAKDPTVRLLVVRFLVIRVDRAQAIGGSRRGALSGHSD